MIAWVIGMSAAIIICSLHYMINERPYEREPLKPAEPFIVSEYYDRMEKADLDILEHREAVEQTIILWWGLDGLRLNEDGELEWVSRRKPRPVDTGELRGFGKYMVLQNPEQQIAAQMEQMRQQINQPMEQTTAQIDQQINSLRAQNGGLELQMIQNLRAAAVMSLLPMPGYMGYRPQYQLTQCCVQHPAQYPPYFYGGCCGNYVG